MKESQYEITIRLTQIFENETSIFRRPVMTEQPKI